MRQRHSLTLSPPATELARACSIPEAIGDYTTAVAIAKAGDDVSLAPLHAYEGLGNTQSFAFDIPSAISTFEAMDGGLGKSAQ